MLRGAASKWTSVPKVKEGARYFQEDPTHNGGLVNDTTSGIILRL